MRVMAVMVMGTESNSSRRSERYRLIEPPTDIFSTAHT
jgi:hypothetical protein